jgi:hypothetical protein
MGVMAHVAACDLAEQSPAVGALLGEPIECAPLESIELVQAQDPAQVEVRLPIEGPRGAGTLHVIGQFTDTAFEVTRAELATADEVVLLVPLH